MIRTNSRILSFFGIGVTLNSADAAKQKLTAVNFAPF
jgi:hypothetical protein